jgi:predicted ATPase
MKISIKNFGAVTKADIKIKPFTVFVGPNNTGKTWTSSLLSATMSRYSRETYASAYSKNETSKKYPELEQLVDKVLTEGNASINLNDFFKKNGQNYLNDAASQIVKQSSAIVGTNSSLFKKTQFKMVIESNELKIIQKNIRTVSVSNKIGVGKDKTALLNIEKEKENPIMYFFTTEKDISKKIPENAIKTIIYNSIFNICQSAYYHNIYSFPSERTGLMTIFLDLLPISSKDNLQQNDQKDDLDGKASSPVLLSMPCADLISTMTNIRNNADLNKRLKLARERKGVKRILELVDVLQNEILKGSIDYTQINPDLPSKVLYKLYEDESVTLEMSAVSSMVKDFAPIILYLRYFAQEGDLIVIDEPEMNLHPEAQVKLIEFLAMLVNSGIYVIITTHSSYMVDHLTNLIKAAKNKKPEDIKNKFYLKNSQAFISQDMVSVNLFGNKTVKDILSPDGAIDWETFSSISERISDIYFEI